MAKKSSPIFYCDFCDMALKKGESIVSNGTHFCNEECKKYRQTQKLSPYEENIQEYKLSIKAIKDDNFKSKKFAIDRYNQFKRLYETLVAKGENGKSQKITATLYCHIANGDKVKALVAFDKWKTMSIRQMEMAFQGKATFNLIDYEQSKTSTLNPETHSNELLRILGLLSKLENELFELLIAEL